MMDLTSDVVDVNDFAIQNHEMDKSTPPAAKRSKKQTQSKISQFFR